MFIYATGFEGLPTGEIGYNSSLATYWAQMGWSPSTTTGEIISDGRYGNGFKIWGDWARPYNYVYVKRIFSNTETIIIGAAVKALSTTEDYTYHSIFHFKDGETTQVQLCFSGDGRLVVYRAGDQNDGTTAVTLAVGNTYLATDTWYYIEMKVTFHNNSLGQVVVRINESEEINLQGVTTSMTSNNYANSVQFRNNAGGEESSKYYDDIYIFNGVDSGVAGMPNNDFIGDCRVDKLVPNGGGSTTELTPINAAYNWDAVNEIPSNQDADYVESNVIGAKDTYTVSTPSVTNPVVYGMVLYTHAKKNNPGTRIATSVIRSNSAEQDGLNMNLGTGYQYFMDTYEYNPITDTQWSAEDIENLEIGIKVKS
jgi:hypothetical protein